MPEQRYYRCNIGHEPGLVDLCDQGQFQWCLGKNSFAAGLWAVGLEGGTWFGSYSVTKLVRTVCHDHNAILYFIEEHSETKNCHIGARLPLWLNSMLAGLSKYKATETRASSTDSVPSTHKSPQTPSRTTIIGSPRKHDWLLAKVRDFNAAS